MQLLNMQKISLTIKKLMTRKTRFNSERFFYEKGEYLKNGISLTEALLISDNELDLELRDRIMTGQKLHEAMGATNAFKRRELSLIRLAEETGDISGTFHAISLTLKDERELNEKIMTVLLYPMLLMGAAMVFLIASVYYIVPPLNTMLTGLGTENRVLSFIYYFSRKVPVTVMGMILTLMLMSLVRQLRNKEKLFRLVLGRKMERYREMSFIDELSLLTLGGLDILECLCLLQKEGHQCQALATKIREGKGLKEAFREEGYSSLLTGYLKMAEETGDFQTAFHSYVKLQKVYFKDYLKKKTAMIEPFAILLMGLMVFLISFIIMIPMLDAYENL